MAQDVSINEKCLTFIDDLLPDGSTILEFGSGQGTKWLSELGFKMYSVENQPEWMDKYPEHTTYINCRVVYDQTIIKKTPHMKPDGNPLFEILNRGWYNPHDLFPNLPDSYDLILVDGPGRIGRMGFYDNLDKFNTDVPIVIDDIQRDDERLLLWKLSKKIGRDYVIIDEYAGAILGETK